MRRTSLLAAAVCGGCLVASAAQEATFAVDAADDAGKAATRTVTVTP